MSKHHNLNSGDVLIEPVLDGLMEFLGAAAPSFSMTLSAAATVQVAAASDNGQAAVAINGKWRYRSSAITAAHPGGAAGVYDVFVTASANDFTLGTPTVDGTNYDFGLEIKAQGDTPSTTHYRKVGEVDWDGSANITSLRVLTGSRRDDAVIQPTAPRPTAVPLRVRGAASQAADLLVVQDAAGAAQFQVSPSGQLTAKGTGKTALSLTADSADTGLTIGGDTNLYRSAANWLKTDDGLVVGSYLAVDSNGGKTALSLTSTAADTGLTIGGDVNLYRSAANVLKTDDALVVAGALSAPTVTATSSLLHTGSGAFGVFGASAVQAGARTLSNWSFGSNYVTTINRNSFSLLELHDFVASLHYSLRAYGLFA